MARALTKKRRGFVKDYVKTGNATEAAVRNFDVKDREVAKSVGSELLTFPDVKEAVEKITRALAERIPDDLLEKVHIEGLAATQGRFTPEGELIQLPDYSTRHKYLDSGFKLKGAYAPEKSVTLNLNADSTDRTRELGDRLNRLFGRGNRPSI